MEYKSVSNTNARSLYSVKKSPHFVFVDESTALWTIPGLPQGYLTYCWWLIHSVATKLT